MSVIPPKSSDFLAGSSLGFVKPMPKRGQDARVDQGDSAEFEVEMVSSSRESALELWRKLQPDPEDPSDTSVSCAGLMLGHFRVEEQIGRGGMGAVFRAVDTRLDREVALKVLAGTQSADSSAISRFQNEARAAARLDHDNVARVFFVGEEQGLHFIAFEFIHGANVRQVIDARGTLSPAETVNYGLQISHALRHIATAGVVHRDVKPSNIILTPTGRAKLVDLGLARKQDPEASRDLTVDGTTLGTFDYISPEQAKDPRSVDIRSDIYSLGCTMYHMLTGEPPYPRGTMLQKLLDHQHSHVPDAAARNGSVPPELSAVVRKMMASDPSERYADADQLIGDLSILAHAYGLRPIAPGSPVWTVPGRPDAWSLVRRNRTWIVTAALLIVGVFVIDAVQSHSPSTPPSPDTSTAAQVSSAAANDFGSRTSQSGAPALEVIDLVDGAADSTVGRAQADVDQSLVGDATFGPTEIPTMSATNPATVLESDILPLNGLDPPFDRPITQPLVPFNPITPEIETGTEELVTTEGAAEDAPSISDAGANPNSEKVPLPVEPFLIQTEGARTEGYFSLEAACSAAPDGGVILLNFDGRLEATQRPVRIVGKRLRLRRSPQRSPIIRFAVPADWTSAEIVRMISVTDGALEVYDVGFEVEVDPAFITDRWVLLSLTQADEVILRGVSVTVRNGQGHPAAIVELAEPSLGFDGRMPDAMDRPPVRFEAEDCFFRGEADLFLSENVDPARIRLSNVALAVDGSLIHLIGMETIDVLSDMNNEHRVELDLRHITANLAEEVVRFDVARGRSVPRVAVMANNSVLINGASRPLVSMSGEIDLFDAQQLLEWSGDHSYVESRDPVWKIAGPTDEQEYGLAEWNDLWKQGRLERTVATNLLRRDRSVPYREMTASDLRLVAVPSLNPALFGASDGTDAGVLWDSLRLPNPVASTAE